MKKEHIMQNAPSGRHRLIHASVASALALISFSVQANTQQFAKIPFYLQNKTDVSGQPKVKHNIMFLIDDSGSMQWNVQGKETSIWADKRITITKEALKSVLQKYGEKQQFQWGLQTLHNNGHTDTPDRMGFTDNWQDIQRRVDGIDPGHATPITRRYYEVVKNFVMPNIKYRCQKSYVIVMSDGDANMSCSNQIPGEDPRLSRNTNFNYDRDYYYSNYYRDIERSAGTSAYQYFGPSEVKAIDDAYGPGKLFDDRHGFKGYFDFPIYQYESFLPENERKLLCQSSKYAREYSPFYKRNIWVAAGEIIVPYWDRNYKDEKRGLRFFSQTLAEKDIKTAKDGLDAAGKSWDGDPSDPKGVDYSKQLVQTFTVGFGEGISEVGREYLEKGASRPDWYFKAEKKEDLLEAFKTIVDNIENDSKNTKFEGASSTAPATTSTGIPNMAATVHLNTGSWSSQLRFYKLNRDGTPINTTEFDQPSLITASLWLMMAVGPYFIDTSCR